MQSKKADEAMVVPPGETTQAKAMRPSGAGPDEASDGLGRLLPGSKVPPTPDQAREMDEQPRNPRLSIKYQAKEISGRLSSQRRSSTPFDRARIGTHTRHGLMPGPRGFSAAKINQDRGLVAWPFNGSYNQALLCVWDGHGSKGERASEFCMKTIPEMLEAATDLKTDTVEALRRANVKCDEQLFASDLGKTAMTCGTTSTVVYMNGADCWTACAGDSRAVKGARKNGQLVAQDLSQDHKPDLPDERARIVSRGGTVSDGGAGRPSRVWAHGRIGLAMSRSIGDGECKGVGVIADPDVTHFVLQPPAGAGGDGDLFVIVASDGVWEFIESSEACSIVAKYKNATEACSQLVHEAAARWKRFEGSYRDDITCIVAFLPFLEAGWADEEANEGAGGAHEDEAEAASVFINMGKEGIVGVDGEGGSARSDETTEEEAAEAGEPVDAEFVARRLSVHNPYDDDWNEPGDGDDDEEENDNKPPEPPLPAGQQRA